MSLSRMTRALDAAEFSVIRVNWISKIYIVIDIARLVLQVVGTVIQAYGGSGSQRMALNCVAGGLIFQLIAYTVFALLAFRLHRRLTKEPTQVSAYIRWRSYLWALYSASGLVLVRNLVRVVEFLQGSDGTVISHEIFLYISNATPMVIIVGLMAVLHPGRLIKATKLVSKVGANRTPLAVPWV